MKPEIQNNFSSKPSDKDLEEFSSRVRKRAGDQRMTLNKLTLRLGWGGGSLNRILKGQRGIKRIHIKEIAQALNCSPDDLVIGTGIAQMMQLIEPTAEQQIISNLQMKIEQLGDEIQAYKKQEGTNQAMHEKLSKENQKLEDNVRTKEVELANHKRMVEENARLKSDLNQSQNESQRLGSIIESERGKYIGLKRTYDGQQAWIQQLRIELADAQKLGNFKAAVFGVGGLFLGSVIGASEGPASARQLAEAPEYWDAWFASREPHSALALAESRRSHGQ